jgi:hypothetical protein
MQNDSFKIFLLFLAATIISFALVGIVIYLAIKYLAFISLLSF